jgi:hypothetical protein
MTITDYLINRVEAAQAEALRRFRRQDRQLVPPRL